MRDDALLLACDMAELAEREACDAALDTDLETALALDLADLVSTPALLAADMALLDATEADEFEVTSQIYGPAIHPYSILTGRLGRRAGLRVH